MSTCRLSAAIRALGASTNNTAPTAISREITHVFLLIQLCSLVLNAYELIAPLPPPHGFHVDVDVISDAEEVIDVVELRLLNE
jgi:hypothetical protein